MLRRSSCTWNVLEAAFEAGVKHAVVASSNSALGLSEGEGARRPLYIPLDETHPAWPTHPYALSKRLNEITAESFGRRNRMRVTCVRPMYVMFPELVPFIAARTQNLPNAPETPHADMRNSDRASKVVGHRGVSATAGGFRRRSRATRRGWSTPASSATTGGTT
jgi:nucleoside-diphosphate-sugar epimerase